MEFCESIKTKSHGQFSVTTMLYFSGKENTSIHSLGEDDSAMRQRDWERDLVQSMPSYQQT